MDKTKEVVARICKLLSDLISSREDLSISPNTFSPDIIEKNLVWNKEKTSVNLDKEFEYDFFKTLYKNNYPPDFYHYTSLQTLFSILTTGKIHLSALTGMNDKTEIGFVNKFMDVNTVDPYSSVSMDYHNEHFIISFSGRKDDFNQWRLYGDDGKGVCLKFSTNPQIPAYKNVLVSSVTYDLNVFSLIKNCLRDFRENLNIGFGIYAVNYWKFFYKDPDYKDENEVRLLVNNLNLSNHRVFKPSFKINRYGIIIPFIELDCIISTETCILRLEEIMVGPKTFESKLNQHQIVHLIKKMYDHSLWNIKITQSNITHYR